ncbi:hypothetical protein [Mycoplasmopsis cynos]|uniref:Uncharacterized protein n=1 Tax=Mycoplasmopsis cynos TaxID=171284 RepID=A0A449AH32_9BACT|nr:hypothetical protein [Mycoplasmopsis cynos]VEU64313.1 Uncharacterised protein [Mycoplasmopsis cynos]
MFLIQFILKEKQKVWCSFEELKSKNKENEFRTRINNARNVGLLRDVYADLVTEKIKQVQEEVKNSIDKTNGSDDYNDFNSKFAAIKDKNDNTVSQKKVDKDAIRQKMKRFGANQKSVKIDIKEEKDKQREKLAIQLKEQAVTLEQLEALKQETNNLYLEESDKTRTLINSIDSHINKIKNLRNLKKLEILKLLKK